MAAEGKPARDGLNAAASLETPLTLTVCAESAGHLVQLRGAAGMEQAEMLEQRLLELLQPATPHLILDLTDLTFISSLGLVALLTVHRRAREQGGGLRLVHASPTLARVFRLTSLDQKIPLHATLEEARQATKQP